MKHILISIITLFFCVGIYAENTGQQLGDSASTTKTDSVSATDASPEVQSVPSRIFVYGKVNYDTDIKSSNGDSLSIEKADFRESSFLNEDYTILAIGIIAILALVLVVVALVSAVSGGKIDEIYKRLSHLEEKGNTGHFTNKSPEQFQEESKLRKKIEKLEKDIASMQVTIQQLSLSLSKASQAPVKQPQPQKPIVQKPVIQEKKVAETPKKKLLYAAQDASNNMYLYNVSEEFDKYSDRTFVIELDNGNPSMGSFKIIDDPEIQERCLSNSDSILCCDKEGNGTKIVSQIPGRVTINNNQAQVTAKAKIVLA